VKLKVGIVAVVVFIIGAVMVRTSGPWLALRAKYPGTASVDARFARGSVDLRSADKVGVVTHQDSVDFTFNPSSVSIGMKSPFGVWLRPIELPAHAITTCQPRALAGLAHGIELWVADVGIGVGLHAMDEATVLSWCREHGIRVLEEEKPR
jgi:hypothetical protein